MSVSDTPQKMTRALFRSVAVPGVDGPELSLKVYYPALYSGDLTERNTGLLPPDSDSGPYPVAILMPGINVAPESYGWLARALVGAGFVAITYGWVLEELPGLPALTPGLDVTALVPDTYGNRASATALQALLDDLQAQNADGHLAGLLNTDRILLGGHSAGGSVALMNARPDWFAGLTAVFAYGAHSKASTMLGYAVDTVLALPDALPTLIMGGSRDGVIAASAFRYGDEDGNPDPIGPLRRTFDEGLSSGRGDCHLAIVAGANHFSPCWPADPATGRPVLDWETERDDGEIRGDIAKAVSLFARANVVDDSNAAGKLKRLLTERERFTESQTR